MKDTHLIIALYRALDRYGSTALPHDDEDRTERGRGGPWHEDRRRSPGWVSISEIEASQSPNTYPRLTRRAIRARCEALSQEDASPVRGVERRPGRLRTWVLVAPPGEAAGDAATETAANARDADGTDEGDTVPRDARAGDAAPAEANGDGTADGADDDEDAETVRKGAAPAR